MTKGGQKHLYSNYTNKGFGQLLNNNKGDISFTNKRKAEYKCKH